MESKVASSPGLAPLGARARFPALRESGNAVFFDNAAGAQVPDEVFEAIREHLLRHNVQRGGRYQRSRDVDRMLGDSRGAIAAFLNADVPEEIIFGLNSTTLIRTIAAGLHPLLKSGDEVVVTQLDHEANIGPWLRLETDGIRPRFWKVRNPGARLEIEDLKELLEGGRVRLVALPLASNAVGTVVDVARASRLARKAGAYTFVDAVHFAPHGRIDVQELGADFLAFSGYKIFGPHVGFLWGRRKLLRELAPAREFFIPAEPPAAFESGTQIYEAIAGMGAAIRYLASLDPGGSLRVAMERIRAYERDLSAEVLRELKEVPGLSILGESDPSRLPERVPTFSFTIRGAAPARVVEHLAAQGIQARDGHMYAPRLLTACGIDTAEGVVRVSLCHYNTLEEIRTLGRALRAFR